MQKGENKRRNSDKNIKKCLCTLKNKKKLILKNQFNIRKRQ